MRITKRNERGTDRMERDIQRPIQAFAFAAAVVGGFTIVGPVASSVSAADREATEGEETRRSSVDKVIDRLAKAVDEREAQGICDALGAFDSAFDERDADEDDRDRERLANAVAKMLDYPRPNENRVAIVAADVLGRMNVLGAERLSWFLSEEDLDEKEKRDLRDVALRALGKARVPEAVPVLTEYLKHHHVSAVVEAATALGRYAEAPGELRKKIAEPLIRAAESIDGRLEVHRVREGGRGRADEEWTRAIKPVYEALGAVTGEWKQTPSEWRNWFENHEDESWDREPPTKSDS